MWVNRKRKGKDWYFSKSIDKLTGFWKELDLQGLKFPESWFKNNQDNFPNKKMGLG
jgi:hypothetical protein